MSDPGSVTQLYQRLANGDKDAPRELWDLYYQRLRGVARKRLAGTAPATNDEEDVAVSALASFFVAVDQGKFACVRDREELWALLTLITTRKALDVLAYEARRKPHGGLTNGTCAPVEHLPDPEPPPDLKALLAEEVERTLNRLGDPQLRIIAIWKLEGLTDKEIAGRLVCSTRTIERKLRLIRNILKNEVPP